MKRLLFSLAFFAVLIALWEGAFRAKIWSPVLLPAPIQVVEYLKNAVTDGTLFHATIITMRRLLVGYFVVRATLFNEGPLEQLARQRVELALVACAVQSQGRDADRPVGAKLDGILQAVESGRARQRLAGDDVVGQ